MSDTMKDRLIKKFEDEIAALNHELKLELPKEIKRARGRAALVVAEIALTLVLLVGAGLLANSFLHLQRVDPGFHPEHATIAELTIPAQRYPASADQTRVYRRLLELLAERPELQQIEGQPLVEVRIERVYYTVSQNSLDVASPPLTVYVAPEGIMSPDDSEAQAIGTIPSVAAMTTVDEADVELTAEGKDRLAERMKDYDTPFNLIVGSELTIQAGDKLPHGRMVTVIKATAVASTGL